MSIFVRRCIYFYCTPNCHSRSELPAGESGSNTMGHAVIDNMRWWGPSLTSADLILQMPVFMHLLSLNFRFWYEIQVALRRKQERQQGHAAIDGV